MQGQGNNSAGHANMLTNFYLIGLQNVLCTDIYVCITFNLAELNGAKGKVHRVLCTMYVCAKVKDTRIKKNSYSGKLFIPFEQKGVKFLHRQKEAWQASLYE